MTIINLCDFYYWYTQEEYMEVSDDVAEALRASVRYVTTYTERARYNKAFYSLDADAASSIPPACTSSRGPGSGAQGAVLPSVERNTLNRLPEIQGRRVKSYKVHQIEAVPKEEWVRVPDTHEAIITHETFDKMQALLLRDTRTAAKGRELHLFSDFSRCADCGKAVTRSQSGKNIYTYKNRSRTACTMHSTKHNCLEASVLFAIQCLVNIAISCAEMIAHINTATQKKVNPTALTTR